MLCLPEGFTSRLLPLCILCCILESYSFFSVLFQISLPSEVFSGLNAGRVSALPPVPRGMTGPLPVLAGSWGRLPRCGAGYYFTGDGAYRTEEGYYEITGRMDDVINISGHRLGTAEIEDAMVSTAAAGLGAESESVPHLCVFCPAQADHPAVPETAVIGYPHDIKGEGASSTLRPWGRGL